MPVISMFYGIIIRLYSIDNSFRHGLNCIAMSCWPIGS